MHFVQPGEVFFLENAGVFASLLSRVGVAAILRHLVDEEQGKHLDALMEQRLFFVEVRLDRLANLDAPQGRFVHVARCFTGLEHNAIGEADRVVDGVDVRHDESAILLQPVRQVV
jgi:hypothetical protein